MTDALEDAGRGERRSLAFSIGCAAILAAVGIVVGVATQSQVILFDGFYTFLGIGLSWLALRISRVIEAGPTQRYPFGREALTPLIIGVEAVALLATMAYATFNAIITIVAGGDRSPSGWGIAYAAIAFVGPIGVGFLLRRWARGSELVSAEATQWFSGGMLGFAMLAAFAISVAIRSRYTTATHYVDPALVIVACAMFVPPPSRLLRRTFVELVEGAPNVEIVGPITAAVDAVLATYGRPEPMLRLTKVGKKLYVEIDCVVGPEWTVRQSDEVRRALMSHLDALGLELWLTLEFTADPSTMD